MSQAIELTISGDALAVLPRIQDRGGLGRAIARRMDFENQLTVAQIQRAHLSGPTTDSSLSVRTNRLRGSVRASRALVGDDAVISSIGSNVKYAAIHEFGGVINRTVKAGSVKLRTDKSGNLLKRGNLAIFAGKSHKHFKSVSFAGGKNYEINMPARAPFGHGIADRAEDYGQGVSTAILNFWEQGQS